MNSKWDLTGLRFHKLLVISFAGISTIGKYYLWTCLCDCGQTSDVKSTNLRRGVTKSCGCLKRTQLGISRTTHGHAAKGNRTSEYLAWQGMRMRCTNPKNNRWSSYGGRGIAVCNRWLHSFENFLSDVGPKPTSKHSLDRYPNVNGNYEPANVRWATPSEQSINRRKFACITSFSDEEIRTEWKRRLL